MGNIIIINASDSDECRIARLKDNKLEEFHIETTGREIIKGNIYKATITRIEDSLQAVFVDYGGERQGFLQKEEIHSDYFLDNHSGRKSLNDIVSCGQELIVQITKDPILKKGAMLTTFVSLPGRHVVLMPGSNSVGVSRKIEDETERTRLKDIIDKLKIPEGFGVIIRTVSVDSTKSVISKDINYLLKLWEDINKKALNEKAPAILYKERNLSLRSIRDYFNPEVTEIVVDDNAIFQEIKTFMNIISPKHTRLVKLYNGEKPIFSKYKIEDKISSIFENQVKLKSGGTIVIEQTEALVAIDVNSGKATQKKSLEDTAMQTNLEACEEIARQLRLRDLGGIIVIDFIDMKDSKHRAKVEKAMKTHLKVDKARVKVGRLSKLGLLEVSRQRLSPPIEYGTFVTCKHCQGKGLIPSIESLGAGCIRQVRIEMLREGITGVKVKVPVEVASYLLNKKRKEILELEMMREIPITIEPDNNLPPGKNEIICE
ncbi:MAG: Rne/Rng family ribonuclease [Desulfobacterales bacterium]|nr:Rne/Rng family ribonuclease [Desulfobacterales bacterium]